MASIKSHIRRRFKPNEYPENAYSSCSEVIGKFATIDLKEGEEALILINNEPHSDQSDGVIFTTERLIVVKHGSCESVPWEQIESYKLPSEKIRNDYTGDDRKMARNDKIALNLRDGKTVDVKIIYGGVYQLATLIINLKRFGHFSSN